MAVDRRDQVAAAGGAAGNAVSGKASVTMAMLAVATSASPAAAAAAPGRPASRRLAGAAGSASTTASASSYRGSCADPTVSRQPCAVRSIARTIEPVRRSAADAAATAGTSDASPPGRLTKTGAGGPSPRAAAALSSSPAAASVTGWPSRVAAASAGMVASNDSWSDRPAYTPPSSGSTSRSTTSGPSRAPR